MGPRFIGFEKRLRQAVAGFWHSRHRAAARQEAAGKADRGNRGAVTAGKNMDGFLEMMVDVAIRYGPKGVRIHRDKSRVVLPGYYRPTKQWDLLIIHQDRLLAAMELKSLCGPSFGNNANNRCEEALGSGTDFRQAQAQGTLGRGASPFLGYFLMVEDAERSRLPVSASSPHFPTDSAFQQGSYLERMRLLCERMVEKQLYSAAAVMAAPKGSLGDWCDLSPATSFRSLLSRLAGHLVGEASAADFENVRVRENSVPETGGLLDGDLFREQSEAKLELGF